MPRVTIRLQTVTPVFLGGVEPRGEPELRAASVRGLLRYWFRVLLGGVIGDDSVDALRKAEALVFGSTDAASPFTVRLEGSVQTGEFPVLPHNPQRLFRYRGIRDGETVTLRLTPRPPHGGIADIVRASLGLWIHPPYKRGDPANFPDSDGHRRVLR